MASGTAPCLRSGNGLVGLRVSQVIACVGLCCQRGGFMFILGKNKVSGCKILDFLQKCCRVGKMYLLCF